MEDSPEPYSSVAAILLATVNQLSMEILAGFLIMISLLVMSAFVSGSEVAFFSLTHSHIDRIKKKKSNSDRFVLALLEKPKRLLATILIANNVLNIAFIILSAFVFSALFDFSHSPVLGFIVQVVLITFLILVFAEVLPKIYASHYSLRFASLMASPLVLLRRLFYPLSSLLVKSTNMIDKRMARKRPNLSMNELSHALEITSDDTTTEEDKNILRGIVRFGNTYAREIMKSRMDVVAVDINTPFRKLLKTIQEAGYSRIPVYQESFDNVEGILYIKDLLPYLEKPDDFNWQEFIRSCFFVPESKKISDLLKEFQERKIHLAVVVDEYGGSSGIITLEDILEEIVGEINDEFDIEEAVYSKVDASTFVFEGRTLLKDFCKITGIEEEVFSEIRGEADTLAGLILEIKQELPRKGEQLQFKNFVFEVEGVDNRRIKRVKVKVTR